LHPPATSFLYPTVDDQRVALDDLGPAPFDHAAIARSLGCGPVSVSSAAELHSGLTQAAGYAVPFVLDVPTSVKTFKDVVQPLGSRRWRSGD
jgi:thiamine pyrophosphate-dependent acetolactate synthase large subunit-like protein